MTPGKIPGLRVQVTAVGTKSFQVQAWCPTYRTVLTKSLGRYPATPIESARRDAQKALADAAAGIDFEERARSIREEDTLTQMFERFIEEHSKPHKRTWKEDLSRFHLYMERPLGVKKISWFTPERVRRWHRGITEQKLQRGGGYVSKTTANHALKLLSVIFNTMRPGQPDPCQQVKKFQELSRDRFLKPEEIGRFFEALNHPETHLLFRDYALISLYTGGRRDNVLAMKWRDIDFVQSTWTIQGDESKNGKTMLIPLTIKALEILPRRWAETSSLFVFFSPLSKTGHYAEPKRAWQTVCKRAGLEDVKLHDLRRTLGSYMAISGANTVAIGKALGHQSIQSTVVYSQLTTDPVRAGMQAAVDLMKQSAAQPIKEKRVPLSKKD